MLKEQEGKHVMLTGAPTTGKSTITRCLVDLFDLQRIPGHTTRAKREEEIEGFDFIYLRGGQEEFMQNYAEGPDGCGLYIDPYLDVTSYNQNYYGTPKNIRSNLYQAETRTIFTPTSAITADMLMDQCPDRLTWIHLYANEDQREQRLRERGISQGEVEYRLRNGDSHGETRNATVNINTSNIKLRETILYISSIL